MSWVSEGGAESELGCAAAGWRTGLPPALLWCWSCVCVAGLRSAELSLRAASVPLPTGPRLSNIGLPMQTQRPPCCLPAACLCRLHAQLIQPCKLPHHESWSSAVCVRSATLPCCGALLLAACRGGGAQRAQRRRAPGGRRAAARLPGRAQGQPGAAGRGPGRRGAQGRRERRGCAGASAFRALACAPGRARGAGSRRGRAAGARHRRRSGAAQRQPPLQCVWARRRGCPAASLHACGTGPPPAPHPRRSGPPPGLCLTLSARKLPDTGV